MRTAAPRDIYERLSERDPQMQEKLEGFLDCLIVMGAVAGGAGGLGAAAIPLMTTGLALRERASRAVARLFVGGEAGLSTALNRVLARHEERSPEERLQAMEEAWLLSAHAAFFEAVEARGGPVCLERVAAAGIAEQVAERITQGLPLFDGDISEHIRPLPATLTEGLRWPNPVRSGAAQDEELLERFTELSRGLVALLRLGPVADMDTLSQLGEELPLDALRRFHARFFELCRRFPEFSLWAAFQRDQALHAQMKGYHRAHLELAQQAEGRIDVGFARLEEAGRARWAEVRQSLEDLPERGRRLPAQKALRALENAYTAALDRPVFGESQDDDVDDELSFPKRAHGYIPQAFKVVEVDRDNQGRLGDERFWSDLDTRQDLGTFLVELLGHPDTWRKPVVILGHPGSGKSLLSHVLAARRIPHGLVPLRVPLRDATQNGILEQVVEAVQRTSGEDVRWPQLCEALGGQAPLVLLDGYDELLQVRGDLQADYLERVARFQEEQLDQQERPPVSCVVTSRVTLIHKARVPKGTFILRLEPFDARRQRRWTQVWNGLNGRYFRSRGVEEFSLPDERDAALEELATQPLLLMMLAIYDADGNALKETRSLKRAELYEALVRRFVRRQCRKEPERLRLPEAELAEVIEERIEDISVAALSMFLRRDTRVTEAQLRRALAFFGEGERAPGDETLLLGQFFFVHESRATRVEANEATADRTFEFLHNTFGEYLAARHLAAQLVEQLQRWPQAQASRGNRRRVEADWSSLGGLSERWYASFTLTPLFDRPVVVDMMRERYELALAGFSEKDRLQHFDRFVSAQLEQVIQGEGLEVLAEEGLPRLPALGRLAIYGVNLVMMRVVLADHEFNWTWDESAVSVDGRTPWERLTYLWRGWFSDQRLGGMAGFCWARTWESGGVRIWPTGAYSGIGHPDLDQAPRPLEDAERVVSVVDDALLDALLTVRTQMEYGGLCKEVAERLQRAGAPWELDELLARPIGMEQDQDRETVKHFATAVGCHPEMALVAELVERWNRLGSVRDVFAGDLSEALWMRIRGLLGSRFVSPDSPLAAASRMLEVYLSLAPTHSLKRAAVELLETSSWDGTFLARAALNLGVEARRGLDLALARLFCHLPHEAYSPEQVEGWRRWQGIPGLPLVSLVNAKTEAQFLEAAEGEHTPASILRVLCTRDEVAARILNNAALRLSPTGVDEWLRVQRVAAISFPFSGRFTAPEVGVALVRVLSRSVTTMREVFDGNGLVGLRGDTDARVLVAWLDAIRACAQDTLQPGTGFAQRAVNGQADLLTRPLYLLNQTFWTKNHPELAPNVLAYACWLCQWPEHIRERDALLRGLVVDLLLNLPPHSWPPAVTIALLELLQVFPDGWAYLEDPDLAQTGHHATNVARFQAQVEQLTGLLGADSELVERTRSLSPVTPAPWPSRPVSTAPAGPPPPPPHPRR